VAVEELRDRNALVTGAGGGLAAYIARALAAEGVNLALSDLETVSLDDLVEELRGGGVQVETVSADLTDREQVEGLVGRATEAIGPLDILVNNAGLEFGGGFLATTPEELEAIVDVNLLATMLLTRAALAGMQERGRGHIVNIASLAGKIASPYLAAYSGTKHGVVGFTHSLRGEYGGEPVGFSAICPGFVSRVGMYGRMESQLTDVNNPMGTIPPERVGESVVRAIRGNRPEVVVNRRPVRPLILLYAVLPGAVTRLVRSRRAVEFAQRYARARDRL
jgi:short-subunit dehydrogenase